MNPSSASVSLENASQQSPLKFHAVFVATSTKEKIRDLNIVAQAKQLPLKFFDLQDVVGTLHNTLEDGGSAAENADKKLKAIKKHIKSCRKNPELLQEFCATRGIPDMALERMWFCTEDSGITLPPEIWPYVLEQCRGVLPPEVIERLGGQLSGPGVDTAPFFSATLGVANIGYIIDAAIQSYIDTMKEALPGVAQSDLLFNEQCVLKLEPMILRGVGEFEALKAEGNVKNTYAQGRLYIENELAGQRISNLAMMIPTKQNPGERTATELGAEYIAHHSARSKAVEHLVGEINKTVKEEHYLLTAKGAAKYDLVTDIAAYPDPYKVGIVNADDNGGASMTAQLRLQGKHLSIERPVIDEEPPACTTKIEQATFHLSGPERLLKRSDGVVLLPDSANKSGKKMSLEEKLYMLQSLVVAKQLIGRDKDKKMVVINTDHSWDEALRIHESLARCQMTKDFVVPLSPKLGNVTVNSNGYFDIINGGNYDAAVAASAFLMKDASLTYHRVEENAPPKTSHEGTPIPEKGGVAIFCSASSENVPLNKYVSEISYQLAGAGKNLICGGGDRYTMGAILQGVKEYFLGTGKEAHIAGISTEAIAAAETDKGTMPRDYTYRELTADIYERMAKMMLAAETIVVAPGGAGTIQEWMGFNLLKRKMPNLFKDKKLVIFDPDLLTNPEHTVLAGESTTPPSSRQNNVFDKILDPILDHQTAKHRFTAPFNQTGIHVVSKAEDVVTFCTGPKTHLAI